MRGDARERLADCARVAVDTVCVIEVCVLPHVLRRPPENAAESRFQRFQQCKVDASHPGPRSL